MSDTYPIDASARLRQLTRERLRRSQRIVSNSLPAVARLLARLRDSHAELRLFAAAGPSLGTARLRRLYEQSLVFSIAPTANSDQLPQDLFVASETDQRPCFFSVRMKKIHDLITFESFLPTVIYEYERRDHSRVSVDTVGSPSAVVTAQTGVATEAWMRDWSRCGVGLLIPESTRIEQGEIVSISIRGSANTITEKYGEVRQLFPFRLSSGWKKIGIALLPGKRDHSLRVDTLIFNSMASSVANSLEADRSPAPERASQVVTSRVMYFRRDGEPLIGILDRVGSGSIEVAVVIPPAWGKVKETSLWLSQVIVESFACAGVNAAVIRYDGSRWRGESYRRGRRSQDGREDVAYTFSEGSQDIAATIDFINGAWSLRPTPIILATVSSAAIEARHAIAEDAICRVAGWISIVGAPDVQSLIRSVSGGIDYLGESLLGRRFGIQEIQGVRLDVDNAAKDAIVNRLGFLDDARREMAKIAIPITWFSGMHDAWIDVERVRDILSIGDSGNRKLIKVPIGHQLGSSQSASEIARMVTLEVARMAGIRGVVPLCADQARFTRRRRDEIQAVHRSVPKAKSFWRQYLLGSGGSVGMELIAGTEVYREFLRSCLDRMRVDSMRRILDLGSGLGTLSRELAIGRARNRDLTVVEVDFVKDALMESRRRIRSCLFNRPEPRVRFSSVLADLELDGSTCWCPFSEASFDCVMIVLVLNYIKNYEKLLREVNNLLKPGGQCVLACLRRDADTSQICWSGISELQSGLAEREIGDRTKELDRSLVSFISQTARLLELEQMGEFIFWDREELVSLIERAGFEIGTVWSAFGDPPQAHVISATKCG